MIEEADRDLLERSLRAAVERHTGAQLDAALVDVGWPDALRDDPRTAVSLLFTLQGAVAASSSALGLVLGGALGVDVSTTGVVLPTLGAADPPGRLRADRLDVCGMGTPDLTTHDTALVLAATDDDNPVSLLVPTAALTLRPVGGIDPSLGLVEVTAQALAVSTSAVPAPGWTDAVATARLAIGHEQVGTSRTMLTLACTHALERIQFGQPIAKFQAVRHRLAETLVAIETAEAALDAGWLDATPQSASMAKAVAGRSARTAARHCQQVLAGIGFTTEHDLHRYVRRVLVLDELFGSSRSLTRELGEHLLATRQLPPLLPL